MHIVNSRPASAKSLRDERPVLTALQNDFWCASSLAEMTILEVHCSWCIRVDFFCITHDTSPVCLFVRLLILASIWQFRGILHHLVQFSARTILNFFASGKSLKLGGRKSHVNLS
jgi:hypothetical protein